MSTDTRVRLASVGDAALIARLLTAFNAEFDAEVDPLEVLVPRLERLLDDSAVFAVLAGEVGFGLVSLRPVVWFDGPVGVLDELYVAPALRSQGLGSALLAAVRAELRARAAGELHINVDEVDADTRRFYERHGMTNVEREEDGRMLLYTGPV